MGRPSTATKSDHVTTDCEWGDYTQGGLFVTVADFSSASALAATRSQLVAAPGAVALPRLGDAAIRQADGVTIFSGTTIVGVYSVGGKAAALTALARKVLARL